MRYKGIIFDFDYTLADATDGIVESFNYGLEQTGYHAVSREEIRHTVGHVLEDAYEIVTGRTDKSVQERFRDLFREKADKVMTEGTQLLPYARELLELAKRKGMKTAIVSSKEKVRIDEVFESLGMKNLIDVIIGFMEITKPKPNEEGTLLALRQMGVKAEECLYIGDSFIDAQTAANADMDYAGVTTGTTASNVLSTYRNVGVFRDLGEIMKWIEDEI